LLVDPKVGGTKEKPFLAALEQVFFVFPLMPAGRQGRKTKKPYTLCKAFLLSG